MKIKNILKIVACAFLCIGQVEAGFSSSSRSSSSSSSSSRSSSSSSSYSRPSSSSSWGSSSRSSTPSTKPSSSWGSSSNSSAKSSQSAAPSSSSSGKSWFSKPQTSTRPQSNVDRSRYEAAVKSGKSFQSRDAAVADFKAKEATKYQNKFTAEPATRPDYIPQKYKGNDGRSYDVTYNPSSGGYGYWSGGGPGLGTWMMYDMMSDAIMMNTMMNRSNYYVGSPPAATVVHHNSGGVSAGTIFLICVCSFGIAFLVIWLFTRNS